MNSDNIWDCFHKKIFLIAQRTKVHLDLWLPKCWENCSTFDNEDTMISLGTAIRCECGAKYKISWQMSSGSRAQWVTSNCFMLTAWQKLNILKTSIVSVSPPVVSWWGEETYCVQRSQWVGRINSTLSDCKLLTRRKWHGAELGSGDRGEDVLSSFLFKKW